MTAKNLPFLVSFYLALYAIPASAEDFRVADADTAQGYGQYLSDQLGELDGHQVTVKPSAADATGLLVDEEGIILVPSKGIVDGAENLAAETDRGAPLGYLFMSPRFSPRVADNKVDAKKLRTVHYEIDGEVKDAISLILAVRHVEGDDWRLYVYGSEEKPLIAAPFSEAEDVKDTNLTVDVKDIKDGKGTLVVTVFKKYKASFEIGH